MKVAVIGGGSTYTPELIKGFIDRINGLPITEIWLMDIDQLKLETVGGFVQRIAAANGSPFRIILTMNLEDAIRGASYVITQLRVGKLIARREDEYLGKRYHLIGQETTGIGGMAKAFRTIPVILNIARTMQELAPGALLINFTNPSGLVTEALFRYASSVQSVGLCNSPVNAKMMFRNILQKKMNISIDPNRCELDSLGINHLIWHRGFRLAGKDVWSVVLEGYQDQLQQESEQQFSLELIANLKMVPSYYLEYYYSTERMLQKQDHWPPSRAEEVMQIESDLLKQYSDPNLIEVPENLMKRGGAFYSTAATQLIYSHYNDLGETHIVDVRHRGVVDGFPSDWVLELPCRVDKTGVHPLPAVPLPLVCKGLLDHVKSYELLAVEAAVNGDRDKAYQALVAHPLGPSADDAMAVLDDLLKINQEFLPQFRIGEKA